MALRVYSLSLLPPLLLLLLQASAGHAATAYTPAAEADRVKDLPGWSGSLPSNHFSGYIPVGTTSGVKGMIHYYYIESERNPESDPLVYWTNGGPGGSGITTGMLQEMGQLQLDEYSLQNNSGAPTLHYNPYSWSQIANTVYVSQPKGVGFSYCDDASSSSECANNDLTAAQDAYDFFINFFERFPHLKANSFYLTAESYGGIYIPMFMNEIQTRGGIPNLKGAAIGDGCWGTKTGTCDFTTGKSMQISMEFFQGHGMYDQPLYARIKQACGSFTDADVQKKACKSAIAEANKKVGNFDVYNIYDTCNGDSSMDILEMHKRMSAREVVVDSSFAGAHPQLERSSAAAAQVADAAVEVTPLLGGAVNDYSCGRGRAAAAWLGREDVQAALHVDASRPGMKYTWGPFNISGDLRPLYKQLATKYRMLIYSGDTDACVPYWGTEEWTRELGFELKADWRPWHSPVRSGESAQRAGYIVEYATGTETDKFIFATVQGAGHMVPTYKPAFALTMLTNFINDVENWS